MSDFTPFISEIEQKYNLPSGLLQRMIQVESSGKPNAISPRGAIGFTQLMPGTAKELGVDPNDPYQNIEGGAKYLRQNLDKFGGDIGQAVAGYNAGPNNRAVVNKDWQMLPTETKNYVNKFADFLMPSANAAEVQSKPVQEQPVIQWDDEKPQQPVIQWDDEQPKAIVHPQSQPVQKPTETSKVEAAAQGAANWGLGGFADEIVGGGIAAFDTLTGNNDNLSFKEKYQLARDTVRDRGDKAWEEHPVAYGTGATVGAIGSPINKLAAGTSAVKGGAAIGGVYGAGNANELSDIPQDVAVGAGLGAAGGKAIQGIGNKLSTMQKNALVKTTDEVATNATNNILKTLSGSTGKTREEIIYNTAKNVDNVYANLTKVAAKTDTPIAPNATKSALQIVQDLDNTALNELNKNKTTRIALEKINAGEELNALEASTLHKNMVKISGVDNDTGYAIKQAQKALGEDITAAGNADLTAALNTASTTFARSKSSDSLNKIVEKNLIQTEEGALLNHKAFANSVKNWSLSKDGKKAIKFNPGLKEDIRNYQILINEHPELKTILPNTNASPTMGDIIKSAISFAGNRVGAGIGTSLGGPIGGVIGEGTQLALRGVAKGTGKLAEAAIKKFGEKGYRAALEAKVAPTVIQKMASPEQQVINNVVQDIPQTLEKIVPKNRTAELLELFLGTIFSRQKGVYSSHTCSSVGISKLCVQSSRYCWS